jgi:hypothetical protein
MCAYIFASPTTPVFILWLVCYLKTIYNRDRFRESQCSCGLAMSKLPSIPSSYGQFRPT